VTIAAAEVLGAWSDALRSPVITELKPGRLWAVATERGDRYVLKKVSTFRAPDPVRRFTDEARILTYLLQRRVPVAVPVLSDAGRACATGGDGAPYAVFPMLPRGADDSGLGLDPVLFRNVGAVIARLHVALAGCPFGIESGKIGPGQLESLWRTAQARLPAAAVTELSGRLRPRWDAMVRALAAAPQRVHGDVHGGNLLTDGQEVTGIIDCDHLPLAPRGYDLGYYTAFAGHWWLDGGQPSRPVEEIRHVRAGYDTVSRLTRQETEDLPALAMVAALGLVDHFRREHDRVEDSWLRTVGWIDDNFDALRLPA
jgi:Ser/Thr protein kinase RdoA (MazF antagonist)